MKHIHFVYLFAMLFFAAACTQPSPSSAVGADQMEQTRAIDVQDDFVGGGDTTQVDSEEQ